MRIFYSCFFVICIVFSGCSGSNIKRNQTPIDASKMSSNDLSDPVSFVENWVLKNAKGLNMTTSDKPVAEVERVLFDGKIYEAVVVIEGSKEESFLISFEKKDSNWSFISQKKVALDYGWPAR